MPTNQPVQPPDVHSANVQKGVSTPQIVVAPRKSRGPKGLQAMPNERLLLQGTSQYNMRWATKGLMS